MDIRARAGRAQRGELALEDCFEARALGIRRRSRLTDLYSVSLSRVALFGGHRFLGERSRAVDDARGRSFSRSFAHSRRGELEEKKDCLYILGGAGLAYDDDGVASGERGAFARVPVSLGASLETRP